MIELIRKSDAYILNKEGSKMILSVISDSVAGSEIDYELNSGEIYLFECQGSLFIDSLSRKIRENPQAYLKP